MGDFDPTPSITLWASPREPRCDGGIVYTWNGYEDDGEQIRSLLQYVDTHGSRLRSRYLDFIQQLGESEVRGARLIDQLDLGDGLSYWWMTLLVEQSCWKSPAIMDALRLFAFEEILEASAPSAVSLVGGDPTLHRVLERLCSEMGIPYRRPERARGSLREVARRLVPEPLRATAAFSRTLWRAWPSRPRQHWSWQSGDRAVLVCTYGDNINAAAAAAGRYESNYWDGLPALLGRLDRPSNWLHLLVQRTGGAKASRAAADLMRQLNASGSHRSSHRYTSSYLSSRVVLRAARRWWHLIVASVRLRDIRNVMRPAGSRLSLWPTMRRDWLNSMRGPAALENALSVELFDEALRAAPRQALGFYLCENQGWECALIHAWRRHGHGQLVGVAHSTIRYWDLRYFSSREAINSRPVLPRPRPDSLALNGKAAFEAYQSGNACDKLVECEALRYGYLVGLRPSAARASEDPVRVLVLTDYTVYGTETMMRLLAEAARAVVRRVQYTVKSHPNLPVDPAAHPSVVFDVRSEPLAELLPAVDVVFAGNLTTASVDAYLAGKSVIVLLDGSTLNFSPLRGRPDVSFVSTGAELACAIDLAGGDTTQEIPKHEFFFLDPEMPRWRRLLAG